MTLHDRAAQQRRENAVVEAVTSHMRSRFAEHTKSDGRAAFLDRVASEPRRVAVPLSLAFVCAALALWLMFTRPLTVTSKNVAFDADLNFVVGTQVAQLLFSDGSQAKMQPGVVGKVTRLDQYGADFRLSKGDVDFKVAKRPRARWSIFAGPYKVRVTGTHFHVGWKAALNQFSIHMWEGHVLIEGPGLPSARALSAGESLELGAPPSPQTAVATLAALPKVVTPKRTAEGPVDKAPVPHVQRQVAHREAEAWASLIARGQYEAVLSAAKRKGLNSVLSQSSLEDLASLADAGRYGGNAQVAKQALLAQRRNYPHSERAVMAAYLLGRLAEDAGEPREAVAWYDHYLGAGRSLALAEESLGRKMLALERAGMSAASVQAARAYKAQYPSGSFVRAASRIEATQSLK